MSSSQRSKTTTTSCYKSSPIAMLFFLHLLLLSAVRVQSQPVKETPTISSGIRQQGKNNDVILVDGFVDTNACYAHLQQADVNGDGKVTADEYVEFAILQTPGDVLRPVKTYQELPLIMQATFVTLTCLCRDPRFGGDPADEECCLGVDAHIAVVGNDANSSAAERTRLFATCFLTDQAIQQVLGSDPPSATPSQVPTAAPSMTAIIETMAPTGLPTASPTTVAPVTTPTSTAPTVTPTVAPSVPATVAPTGSPPTLSPVESPTAMPVEYTQSVTVNYIIAVVNGKRDQITADQYKGDLIGSMDLLASQVIQQRRRVRHRRQLVMDLSLPTAISNIEEAECPSNMASTDDRCENVQAVISLADSVALDENAVLDFGYAMNEAISRGELQDALDEVNRNAVVMILTGRSSVDAVVVKDPEPQKEGLSDSATAGLVVGALAVAVLPVAMYLYMRRNESKPNYDPYEPDDADTADGIRADEDDLEATSKSPILGATPTNYGKEKKDKGKPSPTAVDSDIEYQEPIKDFGSRDHDHKADDSSSNAGSSGWSSSAGLSSLNTGSAEDSTDMLHSPPGASLAAIGAASAIPRRLMDRKAGGAGGEMTVPELPQGAVSRSDLDNAIEAGDWAAVGATAALLAAASDSQSSASKSRTSGRSQNTSMSSVDAARAAELDHLVDAGDWEGVVLAAAKFESQEGSIKSTGTSSQRSSSAGSASDTRSGTGSGIFTQSVSTSISESPSKAQKRDEIRQEVEALVRRVVPEEIDNVDEMMLQFKGREEELVETLRTMQERAVAQKARTAGHKAAKQEARRTVQRGLVPGAAPPKPESTSKDQASAGDGSNSSGDSMKRKRTALELAIEAGDWDAVGEAAALMSDTSTANSDRFGASGQTSEGSSSASRSLHIRGVNAERARELDEMIDRGDWAGVVAAAGRFSQADKRASGSLSAGSPGHTAHSDSGDSASKRTKQLKEEDDALAQAEIWQQIAEQSKAEGGATDAGASSATEWAIARSLERLQKAESQTDSGGQQDSQENDDADEQDSV